jgi:hypothetical protein
MNPELALLQIVFITTSIAAALTACLAPDSGMKKLLNTRMRTLDSSSSKYEYENENERKSWTGKKAMKF